jgi:peptidyl-prolyl cis-trans isomerase SurA
MKKLFITLIGLLLLAPAAIAQNQPVQKGKKLIDQIVAVVATRPILESDLVDPENPEASKNASKKTRCMILEGLVLQKMLINKAELDTLPVQESDIDQDIDKRLGYMLRQLGSQEKLEQYYRKSLADFKADMRLPIKETLMAEEAKKKVVENVKITPSEVKEFYNSFPKDSIPKIGTTWEISHIVIEPAVNPDELTDARNKIKQLRDRILKGENFSVLARIYSEDPGSAAKGGELGLFNRGSMQPEFEAAAFSLKKKGDISEIIKTSYGYHVIQLIEKKGEFVNARHILIMPKVSPVDLDKAARRLDSVSNLIRKDSIKFEAAAKKFSTDKTFINGGTMINPQSLNTKFTENDLDPTMVEILNKLKPGEVSQAIPMDTDERRKAFHIITIKSKSPPHVANLNTDYDTFQNMGLAKKKNDALDKWAREKVKITYIKVADGYKDCDFYKRWIQ